MRLARTAALVAALGAVAVVPSPAAAASFSYGVASAEVKPSSALLWTRAPAAGTVHLEVAKDRHFIRGRIHENLTAAAAKDLTVQLRVARLKPSTRYFYFFHQGRQRSVIGTFQTAPAASAARVIRFAVTGDADGVRGTDGHDYFNKFGSGDMATYKAMRHERNDFNVNIGDTIYSDSSPDGLNVPFANTLDLKRQKYQLALTYPNLLRLRASGAMLNHWDDHEFVNDFTPQSQGCNVGALFAVAFACDIPSLYASGVEAFREYMPVTYTPQDGLYRSFRWGKNLEVFLLDERSFRSARASEEGHVCDNPADSGNPDPGPQLPQRIRNLFALVYKPAANPPRPECVAALNDPSRTMLGARQYARFAAAIKHSKATWKVILNELPMMEQPFNPYDDWMGYNAERVKLLTFLKRNVKNIAIVSTDFHSNWVADARIHTFAEEGGVVNSGILEFITGGVADDLLGRETDSFTGRPGSYKLFESQFLFRKPPDGPGLLCSNMVTYGYVELTATAKTLTVAMKDNHRKEIVGTPGGKKCGPYVLRARK